MTFATGPRPPTPRRRFARWWPGLLGRALRGRAARTAVALSGVAASTLLVLVQLSAYRSVTRGVEVYLGQSGVDLWVAPDGTDNLIRSSGLIEPDSVEALARLPYVAAADRVLRVFVAVSVDGAIQFDLCLETREPVEILCPRQGPVDPG